MKHLILALTLLVQSNTSLSIEAGVIVGSGDVKPVARATFLLLDENPSAILRSLGLVSANATDAEAMKMMASLGDVARSDLKNEGADHTRAEYARIEAALKSHSVAQIITNFSGQGKTNQSPKAKYLFGEYLTDFNHVIWSVRIKPEDTAITLDNNNATFIR